MCIKIAKNVIEICQNYADKRLHMFNRPGVAGAVLHTALSLIN